MQCVSHALLLGVEVTLVVGVGGDFDRHVLHDFESIPFQSHTLHRVVGQQTYFADADFSEDLSTHTIVAQVGVETEVNVGIDGVKPLLLQFVGGNLVHQSDASSFLNEIDHCTLALLLDELHGLVELFSAVATLTGKDVACGTTRVHAHQHGLVGFPFTLDKGDMLQSVALLTEGDDAEMSVSSGHVCFYTLLHKAFALQTVGDEVFNLDEFQP